MAYEKVYQRIYWENYDSVATPLSATNLNRMDEALGTMDDELVLLDNTKGEKSELNACCNSVTYNQTTGLFTFGFVNGTSFAVDLNVEKIPVSFSMSNAGLITMTNADGTKYTADISTLIKAYTFSTANEIIFTTATDSGGNKTITAKIKDGSITGDKLESNFLANCEIASQNAESSASNAAIHETSARMSSESAMQSEEDAEAWAVGTRNGKAVDSTDEAYENNAKYYANQASDGQVPSDWNQTVTTEKNYIKNKPFVSVGDGLEVSEEVLGMAVPIYYAEITTFADDISIPNMKLPCKLILSASDAVTATSISGASISVNGTSHEIRVPYSSASNGATSNQLIATTMYLYRKGYSNAYSPTQELLLLQSNTSMLAICLTMTSNYYAQRSTYDFPYKISSGQLNADTDGVTISLGTGQQYLLYTYEEATNGNFRGMHAYHLACPNPDSGVKTVQRVNMGASSSTGVTITNAASAGTTNIKCSSTAYNVRYSLYRTQY